MEPMMKNKNQDSGFYSLKETLKREQFNKRFSQAMLYSNNQLTKFGLKESSSEQRENCEKYANRKISWKEFTQMYKFN